MTSTENRGSEFEEEFSEILCQNQILIFKFKSQ